MDTSPARHPLRGPLIALAATVLIACFTLYLVFQRRLELAEETARDTWYPAPWGAAAAVPAGAGFELWTDGRSWRAGARLGERLVYGGDRGLLASRDGGAGWQSVSVLDGLPVGRVTAMAELSGRLYLGLGGGLARWDGRTVERFNLPILSADWVTALAPGRTGRLWCATRRGQLLELEAGRFRAVALPGLRGDGVAAVVMSRRGPVLGTFRHGLYRLDDGRLIRPGGALPPLQSVAGLEALPDASLLAATDAGLAVLSPAGDFIEMLFPGRPVSFAGHRAGQVICACIEDQVYAAAWSDWSAGRRRFTPIGAPGLVRSAVAGPVEIDLLTDRGIFRWTPGTTDCRPVEVPAGELASPSVMALAAGGGSVWLGYFDGGIEARDGAGRRREGIETPALNTINHLAWDGARLWAGTAQGVWTVGAAGTQPAGAAESPLRSAYINQVIPAGGATWVCHGQGLSVLSGGSEALFYALHGLPSNKVYCAVQREGRLYVGTLGGLAVMVGERVAAVHQADNSPLRVNWITALQACAQGVVVGTYGGGIQLLAPDGTWREFRGAGRQLNVNPNALCAAGSWILAGTLEEGLWRLDPARLQAERLDLPLPSRSVQAVLIDGATLYVATDNGVLRVPLSAEFLKPEHAS